MTVVRGLTEQELAHAFQRARETSEAVHPGRKIPDWMLEFAAEASREVVVEFMTVNGLWTDLMKRD